MLVSFSFFPLPPPFPLPLAVARGWGLYPGCCGNKIYPHLFFIYNLSCWLLNLLSKCFLFWCRTARWRSLLAGAIAGPSMLLTGPNTQHTSLAIYILMRAAVLASRCGIKSKRFGHICKPLTWSHGDIFLMCLASSQILYAFFLLALLLETCEKLMMNAIV